MALKDPLLEKVYCYHRLAFASKQKCDGKIVLIVYPHINGDICASKIYFEHERSMLNVCLFVQICL